MHSSIEEPIRVRAATLERLNELTALIAAGAVAAFGLFAVIAAETIPGKASTSAPATTAGSSAVSATPPITTHHRHYDSGGGSISASSGPPVAVTGGSH